MENQNQHCDFISGYFLEVHGWQNSKEKNTYERYGHKVFYDGTNWYYDGEVIADSIQKNKYLKKPQFNFNLPRTNGNSNQQQ